MYQFFAIQNFTQNCWTELWHVIAFIVIYQDWNGTGKWNYLLVPVHEIVHMFDHASINTHVFDRIKSIPCYTKEWL